MNGQVAFWLGSGISREKFPNLSALLLQVLKALHDRIAPGDANCPYLKCITEIIVLTTVEGLQPEVAPATWPDAKREELLKQLQEKYSVVLETDVRAPGRTILIRWELLKLDELYGNPLVMPDAEHRFVALLIEEGIVSELVTTNWDALIEIAHEKCRQGKPLNCQSVASNNEWARNGSRSRLIKIHGCARKSLANPAQYKDFLVATQTDIHNWEEDQRFESFREEVKGLLRQHTALFVGLSAQDWNIQAFCCAAALGQGAFPISPQKVYFAVPAIKTSQRAVLKVFYGEDAYNAEPNAIDEKAAVPLYAKPLLGTLFLLAVLSKIKLIQRIANADISPECHALIDSASSQIIATVKATHDAIADPNDRWRSLARDLPYFISRLLGFYRHNKPPRTTDSYEAISNENVALMGANAHAFQDLQWLLLALSIMQEGQNRGLWKIAPSRGIDGKDGQLTITHNTSSAPLFLTKSDNGLSSLANDGFVDLTGPPSFLMIYPGERKRTVKRTTSPTRTFPGTGGNPNTNEIWMRSELDEAESVDQLFNNLKLQMAVALPI